jgi:multimeric flavodoxin WrbA
MKVLALNASQRAVGPSKTQVLLESLAAGMRQAGAEVEIVPLRGKTIGFCKSCISCWIATPGRCAQQDDMSRELLPKWLAADVVVYGMPLYHYMVPASMKAFIERTLPLVEPYWLPKDDHMEHPFRGQAPAAVVVGVSAFPELAGFDHLSSYMRFLCQRGCARALLAEIYRPAMEALSAGRRMAEKRREVLAAVEQAGRELVQSGAVAPATLATIQQPIGEPAALAETANMMWREVIARGYRLG